MATRYNPRLIVRLGGEVIATADSPAAPPAFLAVDKLSVTWGRSRVWDHQQAAQAAFSIIDRAFLYGPHVAPALTGQTVTFAYDVPGVLAERVFFRGAVSDVKATVLPPDSRGNNRGMRLDLSATSVVASLASVLTGQVSYATETFSFRYSRLRNFVWPSLVSSAPFNTNAADVFGATLNWGSRAVVARTYQSQSVLAALQELLDLTGDRQTYDPHTNALGYSGRLVVDDPAGYALLVSDPGADGLALKVPGHTGVALLDGGEFTAGALARSTETNVTAVQATRYTDSTGATQTDGAVQFVDQARDTIAPNRMVIRTDWYGGTDAAQTAAIWSGFLGAEGKRWVPEPITHQTKAAGGLTAGQVPLLLNGAEPAGLVYLHSTDWARAQAAPVFAIIGGTITYQGGNPGWWKPSVQLAAAHFRNGTAASLANARTPANCDPGVAVPIKAADLSPALSAADARFWTAPFTG